MSRNDEFAWLNIDNHRGAGTWLEEMRARGVAVPLALCHSVSQAMEQLAVPFPEAFRVLWRNHAIVLAGRTLIYDLTADRLWRQENWERRRPRRRRETGADGRKIRRGKVPSEIFPAGESVVAAPGRMFMDSIPRLEVDDP
jgi:hypothetical protein